MAESGILARSEIRVMIKNSYLETNKGVTGSGADIDIVKLTPPAAFEYLTTKAGRGIAKSGINGPFEPRGISVNGDDSDDTRAATYGFVNGASKNDPYFLSEKFSSGVIHPVSIAKIRPSGTTARGIIIHG
jgi:hypothetical protein